MIAWLCTLAADSSVAASDRATLTALWASAGAAILLTVVTGLYVWLTHKLVRQGNDAWLLVAPSGTWAAPSIALDNAGAGIAHDINVSVEVGIAPQITRTRSFALVHHLRSQERREVAVVARWIQDLQPAEITFIRVRVDYAQMGRIRRRSVERLLARSDLDVEFGSGQ